MFYLLINATDALYIADIYLAPIIQSIISNQFISAYVMMPVVGAMIVSNKNFYPNNSNRPITIRGGSLGIHETNCLNFIITDSHSYTVTSL